MVDIAARRRSTCVNSGLHSTYDEVDQVGTQTTSVCSLPFETQSLCGRPDIWSVHLQPIARVTSKMG
jgi:hypothetical protein